MDNALQTSSQFDAQLVTLGNWSIHQRRILNSWLEQKSSEQKARLAAQVIASFALDLMQDDVSVEGRVRIKRLQSVSSLLERLVFTTKELERKFYRDHVNHLLKVALLAKAIAIRSPFYLNKSQLKMLILASIFHDIAYPLSECGRIFNETLRSLKDCYATAEFYRSVLFGETKLEIESLANLISEDIDTVRTMLRQMNHGFLSAIEFRSFLKENATSPYSEAIKAIAIHDSTSETNINLLNDPITVLLIIADELQDWGRPTDQDIAIIPRIEDFILNDGQLYGKFVAKDYRNFSVLRQICSKMKNLQRITVNSDEFEFKIVYEVQGFEEILHRGYESVLQILFESVDSEFMNPSKNIDLSEASFFEKCLFGAEITMPVKEELYRHLKRRELHDKNFLKDIHMYVNEDMSEMIISKKALRSINAIELNNLGDNCITTGVATRGKTIKGTFYPNTSPKTLAYSRYLAAEIRFINYLIHEIGGAKMDSIQGFPKLEGLAEPSIVEKASERLGSKDFLTRYNHLRLESALDCLKNRGCFLFI